MDASAAGWFPRLPFYPSLSEGRMSHIGSPLSPLGRMAHVEAACTDSDDLGVRVGWDRPGGYLRLRPGLRGPSQVRVACQVFNAGSTPITFVSTEIFDQLTPGGGPITLDFSNCVGSLAPNDICTFQAPTNDQAYGCKVNILEEKTDVRGTMAALGPSNALLSEADLR